MQLSQNIIIFKNQKNTTESFGSIYIYRIPMLPFTDLDLKPKSSFTITLDGGTSSTRTKNKIQILNKLFKLHVVNIFAIFLD